MADPTNNNLLFLIHYIYVGFKKFATLPNPPWTIDDLEKMPAAAVTDIPAATCMVDGIHV